MLSIALLQFLAAHELRSIRDWATKARVAPTAIYQLRAGRGIAEKHVIRLARVVGEAPSIVRMLLGPARRAPAQQRRAA